MQLESLKVDQIARNRFLQEGRMQREANFWESVLVLLLISNYSKDKTGLRYTDFHFSSLKSRFVL